MKYVTLPDNFISVPKHPGYFWNIDDERLYSLKIGGILTPLKVRKPYFGYHIGRGIDIPFNHYTLYRKGRRFHINVDVLKKLSKVESVIPVKEE